MIYLSGVETVCMGLSGKRETGSFVIVMVLMTLIQFPCSVYGVREAGPLELSSMHAEACQPRGRFYPFSGVQALDILEICRTFPRRPLAYALSAT